MRQEDNERVAGLKAGLRALEAQNRRLGLRKGRCRRRT